MVAANDADRQRVRTLSDDASDNIHSICQLLIRYPTVTRCCRNVSVTHSLLNCSHPNASCVQSCSKCPAPEKGEIIHYYAVNRWDEEDEFDEWANPLVALSPEAERILGVTNSQLAKCRSADVVTGEFLDFAETYITALANHYANYRI